ncbi:MAG: GTP cyclohydrolase I FolE [Armatimonadetes bacterium]|nr:GTP cyclohydrolase I FolE [Armatimonadota bacterium]
MADMYHHILEEIGEDPEREGLVKTPKRAEEAMKFLTRGYHQDLETILNGAVFEESCQEMVVVKDIEFYSLCEHHLLPFFGQAHVAYIPDGKIVGISKVARIVDMFARRLQVQERLTDQIAQAMQEALQPKGVAVILEGKHMCMMIRGVQKQHSNVVSSAMHGAFREDRDLRSEFMDMIRLNGQNR